MFFIARAKMIKRLPEANANVYRKHKHMNMNEQSKSLHYFLIMSRRWWNAGDVVRATSSVWATGMMWSWFWDTYRLFGDLKRRQKKGFAKFYSCHLDLSVYSNRVFQRSGVRRRKKNTNKQITVWEYFRRDKKCVFFLIIKIIKMVSVIAHVVLRFFFLL